MISVILDASDDAKAKALAAGFREQTVLVREEGFSPVVRKDTTAGWIMTNIRPSRFWVGDCWGMGPG